MDSQQLVSFLEQGGVGIGIFLAIGGVWLWRKLKQKKSKVTSPTSVE